MDLKMLIGGTLRQGSGLHEVRSPWSGEVVSRVPVAGHPEVEEAAESARVAFQHTRRAPAWQRAEWLLRLRSLLEAHREEMARQITMESAKPITDARTEVGRALHVLQLAAEEARRLPGDTVPLDLAPGSEGRFGIVRQFPAGPVLAITPFNFPLNLGMHKVAPALACGASVLWKPSGQAPGAAHLLGGLAVEAGLPAGALNVILPPDPLAESLAKDPRVRMVSFTGSARVGWHLRAVAGAKRVALELGGNAAVIVAADAELDHAVRRCVAGGFAYSGQVCISVQRILVERPRYEEFAARLVEGVRALRAGDPLDERTQVVPLISDREAQRLEEWIREAVEGGATVLAGGERRGRFVEPTVLADVRPDMRVSCEEAFGPLVALAPFDDWDDALGEVNRSRYGLQAGVFTRDLGRVLRAHEALEVGAVIVNDAPSYRMDSMPYGGVKESGLGREGVRFAIKEMTEPRLLVLTA